MASSSSTRNRKRRASSASTSQAPDDQQSASQSNAIVKKRKKTTIVHDTAAPSSILQPPMETLEEEISVENTDAGAQQIQTITTHTLIVEPPSDDRRATYTATFSAEPNTSSRLLEARATSRPSLPAYNVTAPITPVDTSKDPFDSVTTQLIEERKQKKLLQRRRSIIQLDGADGYESSETYSVFQDAVDIDEQNRGLVSLLSQVDDSVLDPTDTPKTDLQRTTYESSIDRLTREKAEARASLELLALGLQSMGFGTPASSTHELLESVLDAFRNTRRELSLRFSDETGDNVTEAKMLAAITELLNNRDAQVNSLLDKLGEIATHYNRLKDEREELKIRSSEDGVYIGEMERKLIEIETLQEKFVLLAEENATRIATLDMEKSTLVAKQTVLETTVNDLKESELENQKRISCMGSDHAAAVASLEGKRDDLEARITISDDLVAKGLEEINGFKAACDGYLALINDLKSEVSKLTATLEEESTARLAAENDVETNLGIIGRQEEDLADMHRMNASEKRQREAAETELDKTTGQVKNLSKKLQDKGEEANKIRGKLDEVQIKNKKAIHEFEKRIKDLGHQLDDEKKCHAEEDAIAASLISDLQQKLQNSKDEAVSRAAHDAEKLEESEQHNLGLELELAGVKTALTDKEEELAAAEEAATNHIADLNSIIHDLEDNLTTVKEQLSGLHKQSLSQQQQMQTTLTERDTTITSLQSELDDTRTTLTNDCNEKDRLIATLQLQVETKQLEISELAERATAVDLRWQELDRIKQEIITSRDADISALRTAVLAYAARARDEASVLHERVLNMDPEMEEHSFVVPAVAEVGGESPVVVAAERKKVRKRRTAVRDSGVVVESDF